MFDPLMIYGATGYTGQLMTRVALERGLRPLLSGRDESKLAAMATPLGLEYRAVSLADVNRLDAALRGVRVVLHSAGPFSQTASAMVSACLRTGTHYLDIGGEIPVMEALARRDAAARNRKIMIMPGCGFDVVPSDCLAAHVASRLPGAQGLAIGMTGLQFATRGSAKTLLEHVGYGIQIRRNGVITSIEPGALQREFDYGNGPRQSLGAIWGDVVSAYYTTGIPNIAVYFESTPRLRGMLLTSRYFGWVMRTAPWQAWLKMLTDSLPEGPTEEQRAAVEMVVVAVAENGNGRRACARLRTPEAYTFTGMAGPAIAHPVLQGDFEVGFQTPGRVYGGDFVLAFPKVSREDLE